MLWLFSWGTEIRDIFWLARARHELRVGLLHLPEAERDRLLQRVNDQLRRIFPNRCRIVVINLFRGFRTHPDQFILQVEVEQREQGRTQIAPHVVKIYFGSARQELEAEGSAWEQCWGSNDAQGHVLMRTRCLRNRTGQVYALVYQEAGSAIGSRQVITLEKAVNDCVRYDNPQAASVRGCINTLFANLRVIHANSREEPTNNQVTNTFPATPNLERSLLLWGNFDPNLTDGNPSRGSVRQTSASAGSPFIDPVDYLTYVRDMLGRSATIAEGHPLVPATCMGWVHGDLHGRNILVGIGDNEQLTSPAVFDYGKMGPDQPVVLDFVKLETELKIRALPSIFAGMNFQSRNPLMQEFEHVLNRWTRHCIDHNSWPRLDEIPEYWPPVRRPEGVPPPAHTPRVPEPAAPLRRLLAILLDIRRHAADILRERSHQPSRWFRQYLFWLAYYGLRTVRYTNLEEAQLLSAFLSAGVASAELQ